MLKTLSIFCLALPLLLTGCGGSSSSTESADITPAPGDNSNTELEADNNKKLSMNLDLSKLQSSGVAADKIIVTITRGDFTQTIEAGHTDYSASVEFLNLVVGDYAIAVQIFDGTTLVAEGLGLGTVSAGQIATVNMNLELKSGGLIVNVNVPDSEDVEYNVLLANADLMTTNEKLNDSSVTAGGILANQLPDATYQSNADYAQLELNSDIKLKYSMSYWKRIFNVGHVFSRVISSDQNTLEIQVADDILFSCAGCTTSLSTFESGFTVSYNIEIEDGFSEQLVDLENGSTLIDLFGSPMSRELTYLGISITVKNVDENKFEEEHLTNGDLLDPTKYKTSLSIKNLSSGGLFFLYGYPKLGELSATN